MGLGGHYERVETHPLRMTDADPEGLKLTETCLPLLLQGCGERDGPW